jgi:hypothetical protein
VDDAHGGRPDPGGHGGGGAERVLADQWRRPASATSGLADGAAPWERFEPPAWNKVCAAPVGKGAWP